MTMKKNLFSSQKTTSITVALFASIFTGTFCNTLFSQDLIETDSITDVLQYTKDVDLIVFNISETLLTRISQDEAGNVIYWGNRTYFPVIQNYLHDLLVQQQMPHVMHAVRDAGMQADEAQIRDLVREYIEREPPFVPSWKGAVWKKHIHLSCGVELVEKEVIDVIDTLRQQNIPLLLYTSRRYPQEKRTTERDLISVGIEIDPESVHDEIVIMQPAENERLGVAFENGILYAIKNKSYVGPHTLDKTPNLLRFFDAINYHPKKIVFVDKKRGRIENMKKTLRMYGIKATVLLCDAMGEKMRKIESLSEADLSVLDSCLPRGWDSPPFNLDAAIEYVIEALGRK